MNDIAQAQYQRICAIEDQARHAMNAIRQFADVPMRQNLASAENILAEVRAAAMFLVDPDVDPEVREQVIGNLVEAIQNI